MNNYQNQNYQYQQPTSYYQNNEPVSVGDWVLTYIVMGIPIVGLIMMFVWAFSKNTKKSKSNFCKAMLLICAICLVLAFICFGLGILTALVSAA